MTVLQRFSDTVGIVKTGEYTVISTYPVSDLMRVMAELPNYQGSLVEVATVPLKPGERFLLMRPASAQNPVWYCVCPMQNEIEVTMRKHEVKTTGTGDGSGVSLKNIGIQGGA